MSKTVLAIVGSPRLGGNTELLVDAFLEGAAENGHITKKFHLGELKVNGCEGCGQCHEHNICVQDDDLQQIASVYNAADVVVWASPLYYNQFTGQMYCCIDRLLSLSDPQKLSVPNKECVLLMTGNTTNLSSFSQMIEFYQFSMIDHPKWKDLGMVLAPGVRDKGDINKTDYLNEARNLGRTV